MKTILCIASFEKGHAFLRQCGKQQGWRTLLLTSESLQDAPWPREGLAEIYFIPDNAKEWDMSVVVNAVSYLMRTQYLDLIVALDDFDVEKAALLREHLRVPGMGETTVRYFRDKLAMRMKAAEAGIPVPRFVGILNDERIREFMALVPPPYVLKPRTQAGAIGIQKINSAEELWPALEALGDRQSFFLLEEFVVGAICHVDSIVVDGKVVFALASRYGTPPLEVAHEGRVFTTCTLPPSSKDAKALLKLNKTMLAAFGLRRGVSHSEFIQGSEGTLYFLETSARVGGAHISDLVEAATGLNLWAEWAKLETDPNYTVPEHRNDHAGLLVSLAKQEYPDLSVYDDPEVAWRMTDKRHHAGLVVRSPDPARVATLVEAYTQRFYTDFFATLPAVTKANY